jgi:5-methyltetrahydropteroyltriglutamate--homocysteine methyltransferase
VDLDSERKLDGEIKSWLAFARQKLEELRVLAVALNQGRAAVQAELAANRAACTARRNSPRANNPAVKAALAGIAPQMGQRQSLYARRVARQAEWLIEPYINR